MEKRISYRDFMAVKRTAQLINPTIQKRETVKKKIEALAEEYNNYDSLVKSYEAGISHITGMRTEELVKRVVEPVYNEDGTPKVNKDGNPVKTVKYVPTDIVSYDKDHKQFVITIPDTKEDITHPEDENKAPENTETVGEAAV